MAFGGSEEMEEVVKTLRDVGERRDNERGDREKPAPAAGADGRP